MTKLELSKKQISIVDSVIDWYMMSEQKYITLGGYAGTGKTTILGDISKRLHKEKNAIKNCFL